MTDCSIWACWWWCWWWSGFFNMGVPWCSPDWWWWLEEPLKFDFPRLLHQAALWDNADLLEDLLNGEELEYVPQSYRNLTWPKSFSFTLNTSTSTNPQVYQLVRLLGSEPCPRGRHHRVIDVSSHPRPGSTYIVTFFSRKVHLVQVQVRLGVLGLGLGVLERSLWYLY